MYQYKCKYCGQINEKDDICSGCGANEFIRINKEKNTILGEYDEDMIKKYVEKEYSTIPSLMNVLSFVPGVLGIIFVCISIDSITLFIGLFSLFLVLVFQLIKFFYKKRKLKEYKAKCFRR